MDQPPRVSRLVLARTPDEPLSAGRPGIRRYRLARLEEVADARSPPPRDDVPNPGQAREGDDPSSMPA